MKRAVFYLVTLWILLWGQIALNHFLGGSWFAFDIVLIASLYFGLTRGPLTGQTAGLVLGLLMDAASLGLLGLQTLLYAAAGYLSGIVRRQLDETKGSTQSVFTFLISILYVCLYVALDRLFSSESRPLAWTVLAKPVMNAVAAPFVFWFLDYWSMIWDLRPEVD